MRVARTATNAATTRRNTPNGAYERLRGAEPVGEPAAGTGVRQSVGAGHAGIEEEDAPTIGTVMLVPREPFTVAVVEVFCVVVMAQGCWRRGDWAMTCGGHATAHT